MKNNLLRKIKADKEIFYLKIDLQWGQLKKFLPSYILKISTDCW
jgi:hypothetical protein